jgi:sugar phosphate isomerase/epimerase
MKLAFATLGCPAWSLERIAGEAARMGFDGVELRGVAGEHLGPEETPERREAVRTLFADAGVAIACIMGYSNFAQDDDAERAASVRSAAAFIDTARDLGCPTLRLFAGRVTGAGRDVCRDRVIACLRELAPKAEAAGVTLAMETHDDWCRGALLRSVIDAVASPALGVCWDIANTWFEEAYDETFPAIADAIRHVHFKDAARAADGRIQPRLPGEGEVPMRDAFARLRDAGYDGVLSFEWEKKWHPDLAEPEVAFPHFAAFVRRLMGSVE